MPTKITFKDSKFVLEERYFFRVSTKEFSYTETRLISIKGKRVLILECGTTIIRFDPLLWKRRERLSIVQAFNQHHVELSVNKFST